jgi:hypothetical protein
MRQCRTKLVVSGRVGQQAIARSSLNADVDQPNGVPVNRRVCCACFPKREQQSVVPRGTRIQLLNGLVAPPSRRPYGVRLAHCERTDRVALFHAAVVARRGDRQLLMSMLGGPAWLNAGRS